MKIFTVEGSIDPKDFGITLSLEHMISDFMNWWTPASGSAAST
jgi:predicted metal-dependent phosphotriesterase family hydrolase